MVVIVKLPFRSPGDPVYEERCKRLGERWFSHLALPSAILLLRQGFGRLSLNGSHESIREVRVACAFALTSEQRQALSQRLKDALGRDVPLTEAVDDGLVAGLMITIGSLVLDGSLRSKVQQAARHAQPHP